MRTFVIATLCVTVGCAAACSSGSDGSADRAGSPRSTPSYALPAGQACDTPRAEPDPDRPRMTLRFDLADDHKTVRGTEKVVFTPDRPVTELVFRLSANGRATVEGDNSITVTSATTDQGGGRPAFYTRANAAPGTQGGLLHLPLKGTVAAGTPVTADLAFEVRLGKPYAYRFGRAGKFAYFGSAQPLLAWERGFGWHTEDLSVLSAETATSEAMDVDLTVSAPGSDTVIMSGDPRDPRGGKTSSGRRTWHSTIAAARDVSVAAGPFKVSDATVGDVRLRVGTSGSTDADKLLAETVRAIKELTALFGPYPFPSLSVADLPVRGGGIEFPSSLLLFGTDRYIVVHEVAHQWFYAMVGNSQALHPWLDEAFAQYAEQVVDGVGAQPEPRPLGPVDATVDSFGDRVQDFVETVYGKGSTALLTARQQAGAAAFDQALRCYVARNAWTIASPADVAAALKQLPAATRALRQAGALGGR